MISAADLDWSDEEDELKKYTPKLKKASHEEEDLYLMPATDGEVIDPSVSTKDHRRSIFPGSVRIKEEEKLCNDKTMRISNIKTDAVVVHTGSAINSGSNDSGHTTTGTINKEIERIISSAELPSSLPTYIVKKLGKPLLLLLWALLLEHGMDTESELVKYFHLRFVSLRMKELLEYEVPIDKLKYNIVDDQDYVSYCTIAEKLGILLGSYEAPRIDSIDLMLPCCAFHSCKHYLNGKLISNRHESADIAMENSKTVEKKYNSQRKLAKDRVTFEAADETDFTESQHFRIKLNYDEVKLQNYGKFRVRDVFKVMERIGMPYDKTILPDTFWYNYSETLVDSTEEAKAIIAKIRIDLLQEQELVASKATLDFKYNVPFWLLNEFQLAEILFFELRFSIIDDSSNAGNIDGVQLHRLFASLGSTLSEKEAQIILDDYDVEGKGTINFEGFLILLYRIYRGTLFALEDSDLARTMLETKAQLRLFEEIVEVKINPPPGCVTGKLGGIPLTCEFFVSPPPTSSYYYELSTHSNVNSGNASAGDGGNRFKLLMTFNDGYPYKSPDVRFSNRVFHINLMIGINGECRLLHFNHSWNPCWTIASLMEHISLLLIYPQIHLLPAKFRDIYEEWELIIRALVPATNESQSKRRQKSIDTVEKYSGNDDEESSFKDAISSADSFKTRGSYGPDKYCLIHSEDKDYAEEKSISPRFGSGVRNTVIGSKLEDDTVSNVKLDKIDIRGRDEEIIQRKQTDRKSDQDYKGNYGEIIPYAEDGNYYLDNNSEVTDDNYYDNQEHSEVTGNGVISPPSLVIRPSEDEVKAQQLLQDQLSSLNLSADIFFTKAIQRKIKKSFTRIEELHLQTLLLYLINRKRYFVLVSEFAKKFSEK